MDADKLSKILADPAAIIQEGKEVDALIAGVDMNTQIKTLEDNAIHLSLLAGTLGVLLNGKNVFSPANAFFVSMIFRQVFLLGAAAGIRSVPEIPDAVKDAFKDG